MASNALKSKDLGNTAFKAGDYPTAVGHYTAAIFADRQDHTFYLNRAAAYLKLGKYQDAESDCSKVLALKASNAKALFRRAQARIGLGSLLKAQEDLHQAAKLEPSNDSVTQELAKVSTLLEAQVAKSESRAKLSQPTPRRRRVPIQIIEASSSSPDGSVEKEPAASQGEKNAAKEADTLLKPVSSRKTPVKEQELPPKSTSSDPPPSNTFQKAKQARESQKPSRVGGGIFRASGDNTIFKGSTNASAPTPKSPAEPPKPATSSSPSKSSPPAEPVQSTALEPSQLAETDPAPKTLFDLVRAWHKSNDEAMQYRLIMSIPRDNYPALFKASLEPSFLAAIMKTFSTILNKVPETKASITECLNTFTTVPRFETVLLFLSSSEKETVRSLWQTLGTSTATGQWQRIL